MTRLIDADAFAEVIKDVIRKQKYQWLELDRNLTVADVLECVVAELDGTGLGGFKNAPTVDAAPVIRCEECKYFCADQVEYDTPYGFTNFNWTCRCGKHTDYDKYLEVHTDDFCSWAERKEE